MGSVVGREPFYSVNPSLSVPGSLCSLGHAKDEEESPNGQMIRFAIRIVKHCPV